MKVDYRTLDGLKPANIFYRLRGRFLFDRAATRQILVVALIGLGVRLLIMPFTVHGDLLVMEFSAHQIAYYGILIPKSVQENQLVYPVPIYLLLAAFQAMLRPLMPYYRDLGHMVTTQSVMGFYATPHKFRYLFLLKIQYLPFDFLLGWLLMQLRESLEDRIWVFKMWMLNPIVLYSTYMWGQFDIIPAMFTVAACVAAKKHRFAMAALCLGIGAAFKNYPLLLLPFLWFLSRPKGIKQMFLLWGGGVGPYLVAILPYAVAGLQRNSQFKLGHALITNGENQRLFDARIGVGGDHNVLVYVTWYGFLLVASYIWSRRHDLGSDLWRYALATFLVLFPLINYHPYWMMWVWPILIVALADIGRHRTRLLLLMATLYFFQTTLDWGKPFTTDLLGPAFRPIVDWPNIRDLFSRVFPATVAGDIIRSLFLSFSLAIVLFTFRHDFRVIRDRRSVYGDQLVVAHGTSSGNSRPNTD
ncbi:MAG: hypothetical protein NVS2B7_37550 [Herpetosiphon sp.]